MRAEDQIDQYGDIDTESNRYLWALRRALIPIALVSLVCGLLAGALVGGSNTTAVSRLLLSDASTALSSSELEAGGFTLVPTRTGVVEFLNGDLELADGSSASAVEDATNDQTIVLTVDGRSTEDVSAQTDAVVGQANRWVSERRTEAAATVVDVVAAQLAAVSGRLAALDGEIAQLADSDALRDAYLAERSDLNEQLLLGQAQLDALDQYGTSATGVIVVSSAASGSNTVLMWFIIGAVLGLMFSSVIVLIRAHVDRRVRTRSELATLTQSETLPLVASAGNERRAALAAVDVALNRIGGDQQVLVVPADDARANSFAADLAEQLSNAIVYSPRSGDTVPSNGSKAIVVAAAGRTHADDVTRTNEYLRALGCVVVGSVLGDVAPGISGGRWPDVSGLQLRSARADSHHGRRRVHRNTPRGRSAPLEHDVVLFDSFHPQVHSAVSTDRPSRRRHVSGRRPRPRRLGSLFPPARCADDRRPPGGRDGNRTIAEQREPPRHDERGGHDAADRCAGASRVSP